MTDLNALIDPTLGITLSTAVGINDSGQIIANAVDNLGIQHGFLLTPNQSVPEPSTLALFTAGFWALLLARGLSTAIRSAQ